MITTKLIHSAHLTFRLGIFKWLIVSLEVIFRKNIALFIFCKVHDNVPNILEVNTSSEYSVSQPKPLMFLSHHLLDPNFWIVSASIGLAFTCSCASQWLVFPFIIKISDQERPQGFRACLSETRISLTWWNISRLSWLYYASSLEKHLMFLFLRI